jgi:signal transduction histidine kinase
MFNLPESWDIQFTFFLLSSIILSAFILYFININVVIISILLKFSLIFLIGYPLGSYIQIEMFLMISLIGEILYATKLPFSCIFSVFLTVLILLFQNPVIVSEKMNEVPAASDIIPLVFFLIFTITGGSMLRRYYDLYVTIQARSKELEVVIDRLGMANLRFQEYAKKVEEEKAIEERKRIGRELHDILGYTLTDQMMMIEAVKILIEKKDTSKLKELLNSSKIQLEKSHKEIRNSLYLLRSYDELKTPWIKEINTLVANFRNTSNIKINIDFANVPVVIDQNIFWIIYRSIQESLTNSFRHGKASQIVITFWKSETEILLNIWDNGNGTDTIKEGIGLQGMHERLQSVNGKLTVVNLYHGFQVSISIPYTDKGKA